MSGILIFSDSGLLLRSSQDIGDVIGTAYGSQGLVLQESDLPPAFFDLKTGLAGELFQKLVNYQIQTAVVIDNPEKYGARFSELAYEHQSHPQVRFVKSLEEATRWLTKERG